MGSQKNRKKRSRKEKPIRRNQKNLSLTDDEKPMGSQKNTKKRRRKEKPIRRNQKNLSLTDDEERRLEVVAAKLRHDSQEAIDANLQFLIRIAMTRLLVDVEENEDFSWDFWFWGTKTKE